MEHQFKVGDRVRIKDKLGRFPDDWGVANDMLSYLGKESFIEALIGSNYRPACYLLGIDTKVWKWDERWLELADDFSDLDLTLDI